MQDEAKARKHVLDQIRHQIKALDAARAKYAELHGAPKKKTKADDRAKRRR